MTDSKRIDWTHSGAAYLSILHLKAGELDAITLLAFQGEDGIINRSAARMIFAYHFIPADGLSIVEAPGVVRLVWNPPVNPLQAFVDRLCFGAARHTSCAFTVPLGPEAHRCLTDTYKVPVQVLDGRGRTRGTVLQA